MRVMVFVYSEPPRQMLKAKNEGWFQLTGEKYFLWQTPVEAAEPPNGSPKRRSSAVTAPSITTSPPLVYPGVYRSGGWLKTMLSFAKR